MNTPLVSVITPNYNGARWIAGAIRSVLGQTLRDLELIIADDASTDDSLAVIEDAAAGDRRVRVLKTKTNRGPAGARNRALKAARGRYVAIFDGDDLMAPERLQRLVARARVDAAEIVVDNLILFDEGQDTPWRPLLTSKAWDHPRWVTLADYIHSSRMYAREPGLGYLKPLFRADALEGVRYREDLRIGEDYDLVLRLLAGGAKMRYVPDAWYRYRKHSGSISHALRREHILTMLAADAELEAVMRQQCAEARAAQEARRRSLETALVYDEVIASLKARQVGHALAACASEPAVWPLLAMPVKARLMRLAGANQAAA